MRKTDSHFQDEVIVIDGWDEYAPAIRSDSLQDKRFAHESKFRRWQTSIAAAALTFLLHLLLFTSLMLGSPARKYQKPMTEGASSSALDASQGESVSQIFFIKDKSITVEDQIDPAYLVTESTKPVNQQALGEVGTMMQLEISGSETGTESSSTTTEAAGDSNGKAMLFGRYMGQIKARIDRTWVYPVDDDLKSFQCTAQVKQSRSGEVKEVMLLQCNADTAWQLSLVKAIQAASPLSAPPDDSVFTEIVTLNFDAINQ